MSDFEQISIYTIDSITSPTFITTLIFDGFRSSELQHISLTTLKNSDTLLYYSQIDIIVAINLNTLNNKETSEISPYYTVEISYETFTSGPKGVYVASNGKIIAYDNYFYYGITTLDINAKRLVQLSNYILASNESSVYLFDAQAEYIKNSMIFANQTNGRVLGMMHGKSGNAYIVILENQQVNMYMIYCLLKRKLCDYNAILNISLDINEQTENSVLNINFNVSCWNEISTGHTIIPVLLITYGTEISTKQF